MRFPTFLCVAVSLAAAGLQAVAQTAAPASPEPRPTPPSGPLLSSAPDFAAWAIVRRTILGLNGQPSEAVLRSASATSPPESVTSVTKTGQVRRQTRKLKGGGQEDIWYEHGGRITMESMWKIPILEGYTSGVDLPVGPDFPELGWVSARNFVGTQMHEGVAYFVFESQVTEGNAALAKAYGYQLKSVFNRAYINADTRLPWLLQTGDVLQHYTFQAAPTAVLDVPVEYQAMFDTYEKNKAVAARRPVAP